MASIKNIYDKPATKRFVCEIEPSVIAEKAEAELNNIAQEVEIKGFRKGKVPLKTVKELYSTKAYNTALEAGVREVIQQIATEHNFRLASSPSVKMNEEEIEEISFEVTFELAPEIPSDLDFSQISVKNFEIELDEAEVQKELELIAKQNREFEKKEGKAEKGDAVLIDTIGRIDGVEFQGGKVEGHQLELGSGMFIPGFEDQLIGSEAEENVVVTVTFPEDYHVKELAGKEAQFFTKVLEVRKASTPEIGEELAKKLSFESLDALKADIRSKIENFYTTSHKKTLKEEVFKKVTESLKFDVAEGLVEKVAESLAQDKNLPKEEAANLTEEAMDRLRLSFFLNFLAAENKISVSDQDFTNFIIQNAANSGMNPLSVLEFYQKNAEEKKRLEILLEEEKIYDFIFEKLNVEKEKISKEKFDELLHIKK